jgi:hypothetical protein
LEVSVGRKELTHNPDIATWVDDAQLYRQLVQKPSAQTVPVMRPRDPRKAALWHDVLGQRYVSHPNPEPGTRAVLAWGDALSPCAQLLADRSGSVLLTCTRLDDVLTALRRVPEKDVIVIGLAALFTATSVAALYAAAGGSDKTVGIVCGRTEVEQSYAVAKTVLYPAVPSDDTSIELFDAPAHRPQDNPLFESGRLTKRLLGAAHTKVLRSHGEGGHAKFPDVVVCGLLDDAEFPSDRHAGCTRGGRRCKRAVSRGASVVFADELQAGIVCFICCNGFTVAGELYPSPVSMTLSFTEGWVSAIIAPNRPLTAPDSLIDSMLTDLSAGRQLGDIVARLNQISSRLGQPAAFALHGDPRLRHTAPAAPGPRDRPTASPVHDDNERGRRDKPDDEALDELGVWLIAMRQRTDGGRRIVRAMTAWLGVEAAQVLSPLNDGIAKVEHLILYALKWAEWRPAGKSLDRLLRTRMLIHLAMQAWDRQLARLVLDLRDRLDVFDLGHYDQLRRVVSEDALCGRCAAPAEIHFYGAGDRPDDRRQATLCRVCGPISEHRSSGLALHTIKHLRMGAAGDNFTWKLRLIVPPEEKLAPSAQLFLSFVDKATDVPVWTEERTAVAESQDIDFAFPLPTGLSADLHSVKLVAVSAFDIAYARVRLVGLPVGSTAEALSRTNDG